MIRRAIDTYVDAVTTHNRLTILLVLLVTAGLVVGVTQDMGAGSNEVDDDALGDTDVYQAAEYIEDRYAIGDPDEQPNTVDVVVRDDAGNALSREAFLRTIAYQEDALADNRVSTHLASEGATGPPAIVAARLLDEPNPQLSDQRSAIEGASDEAFETAVVEIFNDPELRRQYLPLSYEPGQSTADGFRLVFHFDSDVSLGFAAQQDPDSPDSVLHDEASSIESPSFIVASSDAYAAFNNEFIGDALWLVLPPILVVMLLILGFAYRDLTDVIIGFTGTIFALVWMFGLMGWMGVLTEQTALIAPVLIVALSIDFGFHIFMRYREERGPQEGIREVLARSTAAVSIAFLLVTITAGIGFLANLTSPVAIIRDLGVAITLGVIGALVVFTTLVPALKVSADRLWERFGFDRRKTPLGNGRYIARALSIGVRPGKRAAIVVIVVGLVLGAVGGVAFTDLDREPYQEVDIGDVPQWMTDLPGPMSFDAHETQLAQDLLYAESAFQPDDRTVTEGGQGMTQFFIEGDGDVASAEAMATARTVENLAAEADDEVVVVQGGEVDVVSPLTVMRSLAATDSDFQEVFEDADSDGDRVPDQDIVALFDAFYEAAPEQAQALLERTDDGEYRSMIALVPTHGGFGSTRADVMQRIAADLEADSELAVTAVGPATINTAETEQIADGIIQTMVIALLAVLGLLAIVYRIVRETALLGALTVVPIALALGLLFGAMYLLGQPLTLLTALLVSITIGLGIDYNIHVSDRFAHELAAGADVDSALETAVTGTGGALLGSALTSGGAFALLSLVPHPQFTSFGLIVALALVLSFVLSVYYLPSLLRLWATQSGFETTATEPSLAD